MTPVTIENGIVMTTPHTFTEIKLLHIQNEKLMFSLHPTRQQHGLRFVSDCCSLVTIDLTKWQRSKLTWNGYNMDHITVAVLLYKHN